MSKFFKSKRTKESLPEVPTPRTIEAITADYNQLKGQAGELQYQIYALNKNLEQINQNLLGLNHEGAARQKLDAATKKSEEVVNV